MASEHGFTVRQGGEEMRLQVKDCVLMSTQRYEAMERAVEFVREYRDSYQYTDIDHFHALDKKATELLAALGEEVSDGD